jgi:hypothetical protein
MIVEFLILYKRSNDTDILGVLRECLAKVLQDNLNDYDADAIQQMVVLRTERVGDEISDEEINFHRRVLLGFAIDFPEQAEPARVIVDEFTEALQDTSLLLHLVKFEDPLLRSALAVWSEEIYALELKLRRVITLIYLYAYQANDPYELLREESVQPISKDRPKPEHMKERAENQCFHLMFNQYVSLNQRPEFKLVALLELVRNKEAYEEVRAELSRAPVGDEDDAVLLAGLKERMDAIEAMRNCCAHNRRPSKKVEENYRNAGPLLDQLLDNYLARWEYRAPVEEMPWDRAAREAVEAVMEEAEWDEETGSIILFDPDDDHTRVTVEAPEKVLSLRQLRPPLRPFRVHRGDKFLLDWMRRQRDR